MKREFNVYQPTIYQDHEKRHRILTHNDILPMNYRKSVKRSYDNMLGSWNENFDLPIVSFHKKQRFQYQEFRFPSYHMNFPYNSCTDIIPYEGYYDYSYYTLEPEVIVDYKENSSMEVEEEPLYSSINDID